MLWAGVAVVTGVNDLTIRSISSFVYGRVIEATTMDRQHRCYFVSSDDGVAIRRICVFHAKIVGCLGQAVLLSAVFRISQVYNGCSWAREQSGRTDEVGHTLCSNKLQWGEEQEPGDNVEGSHCG
jgi:hypothetical protein